MLFLIISLLVGTVSGTSKEVATKSSINSIETKPLGQCQNIRMQQRQIFEKMTRIENQLDAENIID